MQIAISNSSQIIKQSLIGSKTYLISKKVNEIGKILTFSQFSNKKMHYTNQTVTIS